MPPDLVVGGLWGRDSLRRQTRMSAPQATAAPVRVSFMVIVFWICFLIVAYTYVGYPLLLGLMGLVKKTERRLAPYQGSFSFVLSVHNEEANVVRRLEELSRMVAA